MSEKLKSYNAGFDNIIQLDKISETEQESIARTFLPLVEDYFKDPKVQKDYELWLKEYKNRN